jgi:hypothetical protein
MASPGIIIRQWNARSGWPVTTLIVNILQTVHNVDKEKKGKKDHFLVVHHSAGHDALPFRRGFPAFQSSSAARTTLLMMAI